MTTPRTNAAHDDNFETTAMGVSSIDGKTPVPIEVNPATGGVLIDATISVGSITNDGTFAKETGGNLATIAGKDFATQTTLALIKAKTDNIDVALSTRTKPSDTQTIAGLVGTSTATVNVGQQTVNTTAVQISASSTVPTNGILIGALSTNTGSIFIGGSGVTTTTGAELLPGASLPFTCNLNTLYIISAASTTDRIWWNVA